MLVGTPPVPPPAAPATIRSGRAAGAVVVSLVLVLVVGGLAWMSHDTGPRFPDHWDPRVAGLARFVERTRGLRYEHPVRVYFLSSAQYRRAINGPADTPTSAERADSRRRVGLLRALGVVDGDPDLLADSDDLADAGTLAFYDFRSKVVNVRGHTMTPGLRVTLAHELTHVLQDQHFDVTAAVDGKDSEAAEAARSIVEGDAVDVENRYVDKGLTAAERTAYEKEQQGGIDHATTQLGDVPDFLTGSFGAPYAFGPSFVSLFGSSEDGATDNAAIDGLLRSPPPAMSRLFDPADQLHRRPVQHVATPDVPHAVFDQDTIGAVTLFAMLADRVDPVTAMDATDGMGWRHLRRVRRRARGTTGGCASRRPCGRRMPRCGTASATRCGPGSGPCPPPPTRPCHRAATTSSSRRATRAPPPAGSATGSAPRSPTRSCDSRSRTAAGARAASPRSGRSAWATPPCGSSRPTSWPPPTSPPSWRRSSTQVVGEAASSC